MSAVFVSECVVMDSVLIIGIVAMVGWAILVPLVSILQSIWKWTDDEFQSFFLNPITCWIMTTQLGYVPHTGVNFDTTSDYYYAKYNSNGNLDETSDGWVGWWFGVWVIFCLTVIAFLLSTFPLTALAVCVILISLHATRFVKRLNRKVNALEK